MKNFMEKGTGKRIMDMIHVDPVFETGEL